MTFDDDHRFAHEEDTPMNPLGESLMNDPFLATPEPMPNMPIAERKDIDQALSLLQLSGGSGSQVRRRLGGKGESGAGSSSSVVRRFAWWSVCSTKMWS